MRKRQIKKIIHEGDYIAEVEIELIDTDFDWSPCLSVEDAMKIDEVRDALRRNDIASASHYARVYSLNPVIIQSDSGQVPVNKNVKT